MSKTRVIFFVIIGIAVLIIVAGLLVTQIPRISDQSSGTPTPEVSDELIEVRIVTAIPV